MRSLVPLIVVLLWHPWPVDAAESARAAYVRLTDGVWQVWLYDGRQGEHRQLTFSQRDKFAPAAAPGGGVLFRDGNDRLFVIGPESDEEKPVYEDVWPCGNPAWAQSGEVLAIPRLRTEVRDASAIWLIDRATSERRVLHSGPGFRMHPAWLPDGRRLLYILSHGAAGTELRRVDLEGGDEVTLIEGSFHLAYPAPSVDGSHIAFASDQTGNYEIWLARADGSNPRRITDHAGLDIRPVWDPSGGQLSFTTFRQNRFQVWSVSREGQDLGPLFDLAASTRDLTWL